MKTWTHTRPLDMLATLVVIAAVIVVSLLVADLLTDVILFVGKQIRAILADSPLL